MPPADRTLVIGVVTETATFTSMMSFPAALNVTYTLDEMMLGQHAIRVVAYDNAGNMTAREITI